MSGPADSSPTRRPNSVRRTTTHDSLRLGDLLGPVTLEARGRDLLTGATGTATVLDAAVVRATVAFPDREVERIEVDPPHPGVQRLVGLRASSGFRQAIDDAMPGARESRGVRFQLLDDLPTALLVSGYATHAARLSGSITPKGPRLQHPDLCAGWVTGGTLLASRQSNGVPGPRIGPVAPSVIPDDDPLAWHETAVLPAHGMRRRRRIDVWEQDGIGQVDGFFRDSHVDADGVETIVHEYSISATVDLATRTFGSCHASVGALPYPECPNAAASSERLQGAPVLGLRRWVRDTFVGPTTCTHLNDTLRALEDVGGLLAALPAA